MIEAVNHVSLLLIPAFILFAVVYGALKKVDVYDSFVAGAREGPQIILKIFPYLLAIFIAIKGFQASGAFDFIRNAFHGMFSFTNVPLEVMSMAIVKPLSGSAATALFTDIIRTTGVDSTATRIAAIIMGSAETTFYVLAVYLGSVNIRNTRYLVPVCLAGDVVGIAIAIWVA